MLEFAVEVLIANQLATRPQAEADKFREEFIARFNSPRFTAHVTTSEEEQTEAWIAQRIVAMSENLMTKVADREAEIRRKTRK